MNLNLMKSSKMTVYWTFVLITLTMTCLGSSNAANCTSRGRFPNDEIADCRGYTTCLAGAADVFYKYDLACPETFIYNHIDNQCSNAMYYTCLPSYNCSALGNFPDTQITNCSSYIACIKGLDDNIVTARLVECDTGLVFSPVEEKCVNTTSYKCPIDSSTLEIVGETVPGDNGNNGAANLNVVVSVWIMLLMSILFYFI